jgi:hypothetical protein
MPKIAKICGADLSEEPIAGGSAFCPASIAAKYSPHLASEEQLTWNILQNIMKRKNQTTSCKIQRKIIKRFEHNTCIPMNIDLTWSYNVIDWPISAQAAS